MELPQGQIHPEKTLAPKPKMTKGKRKKFFKNGHPKMQLYIDSKSATLNIRNSDIRFSPS